MKITLKKPPPLPVNEIVDKNEHTVKGTLSRIAFQNEGYLIGKLDNGIGIKGNMVAPQIGLEYELTGYIEEHPRFGSTLIFSSFKISLPKTIGAIRRYLIENCPYVGVSASLRLIQEFGENALVVCKESPEKVAKLVRGITLEKAERIQKLLKDNEDMEALQLAMNELFHGVRITKRAISELINIFGQEAPAAIKADPYGLIKTIRGYSWMIADAVAIKVGFDMAGLPRVKAAINHVLITESRMQGHTALEEVDLVEKSSNLTGRIVTWEKINEGINSMIKDGDLVREDQLLSSYKLHSKEKEIADCLVELLLATPTVTPEGIASDNLHDDQKEAFNKMCKNNVFILTGPPGTGKTYTIKYLLEAFPTTTIMDMAAPTGKAAKRMMELGSGMAMTIHRLLEPDMSNGYFQFTRNSDDQLDSDVIVIDEASMLDVHLAHALVTAIPKGARLILVGDIYQLPAVGAGNVLKDLISSTIIPCVELKTIKRQNPGLIIENCHRVKNGKQIIIDNSHKKKDFFFMHRSTPESIVDTIKDLVSKRLPDRYGINNIDDIQVLSAMREKTLLGCKNLNIELQSVLNKGEEQGKLKFRINDKVIQTVNDYSLGIINGDIGRIIQIIPSGVKKGIQVNFQNPERVVWVHPTKHSLELAYVVTCVSKDTWVWTNEGMQQIDSIIDSLPVGEVKSVSNKSVGTPNGCVPLKYVIHRGVQPTIHIKTRLGISLSASLNHRVLTIDPITGEEEWVMASNLKLGSILPIPRGTSIGPDEEFSTSEYHVEGFPKTITSELAEVMGALVADGCYSKPRDAHVEMAKNKQQCEYIRDLVEKTLEVKCTFGPIRNSWRFYFHSVAARSFLLWCGLDYVKGNKKTVPWTVLRSPLSVQAAFLRGLFSGDGSISKNRIVLATSSKNLAEQVQLMLLNLGIISKRYVMREATEKWNAAWRIDIYGIDIDIFIDRINFSHEEKRAIASTIREVPRSEKTNTDTIPCGKRIINDLREALRRRSIHGRNYPEAKLVSPLLSLVLHGSTRLTYAHVTFLLKNIDDWSNLPKDIPDLNKQQWFYDKVVELEHGHEDDLYDLTVPSPHSYLSNGIISHNCHKFQGSECPFVVIPIHKCLSGMVTQRNWLYTAISRAKQACILVGSEAEVWNIVGRNSQQRRITRLDGMLVNKHLCKELEDLW